MKAIVTGIKPYTSRLREAWTDHGGRCFSAFEPIRTYRELMVASRSNGNTGNYFIGEGAIEAVGRERAFYWDFGHLFATTKDPDRLDALHKQFDCLVFVTANLLRSDYDAALEADLLSRLDLPVVVLGIGCQRVRDLAQKLPPGTMRFIELLRSRIHHIFTRGAPSTDYLLAQGLWNVWPTGCPSIFLRPHNVVTALQRLKSLDWGARLRLAFCGYLGRDITAVEDIEAFDDRPHGCSYVLQDEHMFHQFELDTDADALVYNDLSGELEPGYGFRGAERVAGVGMRIFFNTHQWRAFVAAHDLSFGKRFHGIVAALQTGTPGLAIAIDDRMTEMLEQLELPYIEGTAWREAADKKALIDRTMSRFDPDRSSEAILKAAELFRGRLAAIGLG